MLAAYNCVFPHAYFYGDKDIALVVCSRISSLGASTPSVCFRKGVESRIQIHIQLQVREISGSIGPSFTYHRSLLVVVGTSNSSELSSQEHLVFAVVRTMLQLE